MCYFNEDMKRLIQVRQDIGKERKIHRVATE